MKKEIAEDIESLEQFLNKTKQRVEESKSYVNDEVLEIMREAVDKTLDQVNAYGFWWNEMMGYEPQIQEEKKDY